MLEQVTVEKIDAEGVHVGCDASACGSCKGSFFCNNKHKTFIATNPNRVVVHAGDTVELYLHPGKTIFGSFLTLIFPLILFPAGYYLAGLLMHDPSEVVRMLVGVGGIAIGFLIAWLFFRKRQESYTPQIVRVVQAGGCDHDCKNCAISCTEPPKQSN